MIGVDRSSTKAGELVMKIISTVCVTVLMLGSAYARAQSAGEDQPYEEAQAETQPAQPPSAAPTEVPPAPPQQLPAPPQAQVPQQQYQQPVQAAPPAVAQAPATGQWVYTSQYGWVWIPYGSQYTYTPTAAGVYPSEYVYYPTYGWTWVTAPWVFGWGIQPFFGVYGPYHYGWYHHAVAYGGWRGYGYGRAYGGGYRGYGYGGAYRPAYGGYRAGFAAPHTFGYGAGAHVYRGAPAYGGHVGGGWRAPVGGGFHGGFGGGHAGGFHGGGFGGGHGGFGHGGRH